MTESQERAARNADLFCVCRADLDRLSRWITRMGSGQTLTSLARRFTRGRLRYGPLTGEAALSSPAQSLVRRWDPHQAWHEGEGVVFPGPGPDFSDQDRAPCFGEIVRVQAGQVGVRIDGGARILTLSTAASQETQAAVARWRDALATRVADAWEREPRATRPSQGLAGRSPHAGASYEVHDRRSGEAARIDDALWRYGEQIFGNLLAALRHDIRFLVVDGRWFLRSLVVRPDQAQLEALAQRLLLDLERPFTLEEMVALSPAMGDGGDPVLFGLALALQERPDLFTQISEGAGSRWVLSAPPAGVYVAKLAAYDPETLVVLCEPGELLSEETVERLWALNLFGSVVSFDRRHGSTAGRDTTAGRGTTAGRNTPAGRV